MSAQTAGIILLFTLQLICACVCVCVSGVLAFFFLTKQIPAVQEDVSDLNFLWVPLLVRVQTHKSCKWC